MNLSHIFNKGISHYVVYLFCSVDNFHRITNSLKNFLKIPPLRSPRSHGRISEQPDWLDEWTLAVIAALNKSDSELSSFRKDMKEWCACAEGRFLTRKVAKDFPVGNRGGAVGGTVSCRGGSAVCVTDLFVK
jgi:hypothetical protein